MLPLKETALSAKLEISDSLHPLSICSRDSNVPPEQFFRQRQQEEKKEREAFVDGLFQCSSVFCRSIHLDPELQMPIQTLDSDL